MKFSKFILALLYNCLVGLILSSVIAANPSVCIAAVNLIGSCMYLLHKKYGKLAFEGLAAEVWLPDVMEDFYPDNSFLREAEPMDQFVTKDIINLAEAGVDPDVIINNTTYPITETVANDVPHSLALDTYDTTSTIIRNAQAVELVYDQRTLYTNKHKKALLNKFSTKAIHAYAPQSNNSYNPVMVGTTSDSVLDMIIDLEQKFNDLDVPEENRVLVLCSKDQASIAKENKALYKEFMAKPGSVLYSFKIYRFSKAPAYNKTTGAKIAYGAALNPTTDILASVAFHSGEVMKAQGTFDFFSRLKDPDVKGDKFNYQMRALALPKRNKYCGAIIRG
jgi:hypothetical protein